MLTARSWGCTNRTTGLDSVEAQYMSACSGRASVARKHTRGEWEGVTIGHTTESARSSNRKLMVTRGEHQHIHTLLGPPNIYTQPFFVCEPVAETQCHPPSVAKPQCRQQGDEAREARHMLPILPSAMHIEIQMYDLLEINRQLVCSANQSGFVAERGRGAGDFDRYGAYASSQ